MIPTVTVDETPCAHCGASMFAGTTFCSRECARLAPISRALTRIADALAGDRNGTIARSIVRAVDTLLPEQQNPSAR